MEEILIYDGISFKLRDSTQFIAVPLYILLSHS
jgi:hypothetical protein